MENEVLFYEEAKAAGHKRYQGPPCKYGHSGVRYVSSTNCIECKREQRRRNYNTEEGRRNQIEHVVLWQKRHPEQYRRYQTAWRRKQTAERCADQVNAGICPRKHCPMRNAKEVKELTIKELMVDALTTMDRNTRLEEECIGLAIEIINAEGIKFSEANVKEIEQAIQKWRAGG